MKFSTKDDELACNGQSPCILPGNFVDQNNITVSSLPLAQLTYKNGTALNQSTEVVVELSVFNNIFTNEKLSVKYYAEPTFKETSQASVPLNL